MSGRNRAAVVGSLATFLGARPLVARLVRIDCALQVDLVPDVPGGDAPGDLGGEVGLEAGSNEELVGPGPAAAKVGDPAEGGSSSGQEPPGGLGVGDAPGGRDGTRAGASVRSPVSERLFVGRGGRLGRLHLPFGEDPRDRRRIDAEPAELAAEGDLAPWPGPIPGRDPGPGEGQVVEVAEVDEAGDGGLDEEGREAGLEETAADFGDRPGAGLEVTGGRVEDGADLGQGGPFGPAIAGPVAAGRPTRPPRSPRRAGGPRRSATGSGPRSPRRRPGSSGGTPSPPPGPGRVESRRR